MTTHDPSDRFQHLASDMCASPHRQTSVGVRRRGCTSIFNPSHTLAWILLLGATMVVGCGRADRGTAAPEPPDTDGTAYYYAPREETEFDFPLSEEALSDDDETWLEFAPVPSDSEPAAGDVADASEARDSTDGDKVTVLYGTCRAMIVDPPSWIAHCLGFIGTTNGWITVSVLGLVVILVLLVVGFFRRLSLILTAKVIIGACLLYALATGVHGFQQVADYRQIEGVFGNQRGELRYGLCEVSVPRKREKGTPPSPYRVYLIRMPEDPDKHFIVTDLRDDKEAFTRELKKRVAASDKKDAFVFIHGYNVTFGDAVKRTAQLCVDMEFQGAPLCFTWPSQGELKDYLADSTTARVASFRLREFLLEIEKESGAERIHLIAHSMGNDVLTQAMERMKDRLRERDCKFREVLLAAPDIDRDVFFDLASAIRNDVQHITLYASARDRALNESYRLSGAPRAGMAGRFLTLVDGIDTVDVTNLDTDFLGHSTYGDHPLAVGDLGLLLREGRRPQERGLIPGSQDGRTYWQIRN